MQHSPHHVDPHCQQCLTSKIKPYFQDLTPRDIDTMPERLTDASETMEYYQRPDKERSTLHFGQLKLWISEVKLLARFTRACEGVAYTVVYAGAAPGHHIPHLASLFPTCTFELYDPVDFCPSLKTRTPKNVKIYHRTYFTDQTVNKYQGIQNLVFISDIRTGTEESYVEIDMLNQQKWVKRLQPEVSMLKFRLPWTPGQTPYLGGIILLPAFAPTTSTEMRLICTRNDILTPKLYDNTWYERVCAFHNTVGRARMYQRVMNIQVEGLDRCHDCSMLVSVVTEYLFRNGTQITPNNIKTMIDNLIASLELNRTIKTAHTVSSTHKKYRR